MVDGAEVGQRLGTSHRLRDDLHPAAADQAVRPTVIMVEEERMECGSIPAELPHRLLLHLILDTTAAESPHLAARRVDDHHGPRLLGRRSAGLHDLTEDQFAILLQSPDNLPYHVAHTLRFPIAGSELPRDHGLRIL